MSSISLSFQVFETNPSVLSPMFQRRQPFDWHLWLRGLHKHRSAKTPECMHALCPVLAGCLRGSFLSLRKRGAKQTAPILRPWGGQWWPCCGKTTFECSRARPNTHYLHFEAVPFQQCLMKTNTFQERKYNGSNHKCDNKRLAILVEYDYTRHLRSRRIFHRHTKVCPNCTVLGALSLQHPVNGSPTVQGFVDNLAGKNREMSMPPLLPEFMVS